MLEIWSEIKIRKDCLGDNTVIWSTTFNMSKVCKYFCLHIVFLLENVMELVTVTIVHNFPAILKSWIVKISKIIRKCSCTFHFKPFVWLLCQTKIFYRIGKIRES